MYFPIQELIRPRLDRRIRTKEKKSFLVASAELRLFKLAELALHFNNQEKVDQVRVDALGLMTLRLYWGKDINRAVIKLPDFLFTWDRDSARINSWLNLAITKPSWLLILNQAKNYSHIINKRQCDKYKHLNLGKLDFKFKQLASGDIELTTNIMHETYTIEKVLK